VIRMVKLGGPVFQPIAVGTLLQDDFEAALLKWTDFGTGTGHAISRITTKASHGEACLRVTSGSANGDVGEAGRAIGWRPRKYVSFTFWFSMTSLTNVSTVWAKLEARDGVNREEYQVRWVISTGAITIRTPAGYVTLGTKTNIAYGDQIWHYLRIVLNPIAKRYVSVQLDERIYYPVDQAPYATADIAWPETLALVLANTCAGVASVTTDFDDVVLKESDILTDY